jgi:predicted enzyme related to lactoylglutathione lyase
MGKRERYEPGTFCWVDLEQGAPPSWFSYVSVDDADAVASRARELGGTVYGEAFDVLDAGRMAVIGDPTGPCSGPGNRGSTSAPAGSTIRAA